MVPGKPVLPESQLAVAVLMPPAGFTCVEKDQNETLLAFENSATDQTENRYLARFQIT